MLAMGHSDATKLLRQELAKDMAMRWGTVTEKPQEFLGRLLSKTPKSHTFGETLLSVSSEVQNNLFFEKIEEDDTALDEAGQRQYNCLANYSVCIFCHVT